MGVHIIVVYYTSALNQDLCGVEIARVSDLFISKGDNFRQTLTEIRFVRKKEKLMASIRFYNEILQPYFMFKAKNYEISQLMENKKYFHESCNVPFPHDTKQAWHSDDIKNT